MARRLGESQGLCVLNSGSSNSAGHPASSSSTPSLSQDASKLLEMDPAGPAESTQARAPRCLTGYTGNCETLTVAWCLLEWETEWNDTN